VKLYAAGTVLQEIRAARLAFRDDGGVSQIASLGGSGECSLPEVGDSIGLVVLIADTDSEFARNAGISHSTSFRRQC
jgi:hypothetical protein